ncbi:MAG: [Fe-Fe] hydrogenase large subunit C-terminal domain-containing protein [Candidatus Enterenecus sp.]
MRHSVVLEYKKCRGCTTCIKNCPTEAIRVRSGKATILPNRCIDCGTCSRVCPHNAIKSVPDDFNALQNYQYTIAVPDPSLYAQFQNLDDLNLVLNGLLELGFDRVYEAAAAAEQLAGCLRGRQTGRPRPVPEISSVCPAVVRLISIRFPDLLGHLAPPLSHVELAAILARRAAAEETGLLPDEIGVFSIVPCSSLVTAARQPTGLTEPVLDGAFAVRDVYRVLLDPMKKLDLDREHLLPLVSAGARGVAWAYAGGEARTRGEDHYVAVDGIDNVIAMLEEIEDGRLPDADFIELRACTKGCLGGCFTVTNPFTAKMHLRQLIRDFPDLRSQGGPDPEIEAVLDRLREPEFLPTYVLDPDRRKAMEKMQRIQALEEQLPGLRCGSCGAPSCRAFAEDVVMGRASEDDCIFKVRARMKHMAEGADPDEYLPAPFRRRKSPHTPD